MRPSPERVEIYTGEMLIGRSDFMRTKFYNDFCLHHDITRMVTAVMQTNGDLATSVGGAPGISADVPPGNYFIRSASYRPAEP